MSADSVHGLPIGQLLAGVLVARSSQSGASDSDVWRAVPAAGDSTWLLELHSDFHLDNWLEGATSTIATPANFAREVLRPEAQAWSMEQRVPRFVDKIVVGRGRSCDVVVPAASISKQHAYLARAESGAIVQDAGSRNGTFVNGRRLTGGERAPLLDGDILQLGPEVALCFVVGSTLRLLVETL